jgi:hypothetical protein
VTGEDLPLDTGQVELELWGPVSELGAGPLNAAGLVDRPSTWERFNLPSEGANGGSGQTVSLAWAWDMVRLEGGMHMLVFEASLRER